MQTARYVPRNKFNVENYPDLVGRTVNYLPSFVGTRPALFDSVEWLITEQDVITAVGVAKLDEAIRNIKKVGRSGS